MTTSPGTTQGLSCSPSFKIRTSDHKDTLRVEIEVFSSEAPVEDFSAVHQSIAFYLRTPETMRKLASDLVNAAQGLRFMAEKVEAQRPRPDGLKPCGCVGGCMEIKPMGYTDEQWISLGGGKRAPGVYCEIERKAHPNQFAIPIDHFLRLVRGGQWPNVSEQTVLQAIEEGAHFMVKAEGPQGSIRFVKELPW